VDDVKRIPERLIIERADKAVTDVKEAVT